MADEEKRKGAIFARELPSYTPEEVLGLYYYDKWESFDQFLTKCKKENVEALSIAFPEVLGDDYIELLVNLSKIAEANLSLLIAGKSPTTKKMGELSV